MSSEPTKEQLLDDYRARQVATVLSLRGEVLGHEEQAGEEVDPAAVVDADGCNLDARVIYALQLDYSPVQIEIRHGLPRDVAAALLRKAAEWIEQEGDRLMELRAGQLASRVPTSSEYSEELFEE
jgi:hypothetical protein